MNLFTSRLYEQYARISKALSSPRRIELLECLAQAPRSVEDLAQLTGMGVANTSHHLQQLRQARLVEADKQGFYVFYRLASPDVQAFIGQLADLAQSQLAEVQQIESEFMTQMDWESVGYEELRIRLESGAVLLDVRPTVEYEAGHIPGAISMPLPELSERMVQLPKERDVIAYCRGPYCIIALEAIHQLADAGFKTLHYRDGMEGWTLHQSAGAV